MPNSALPRSRYRFVELERTEIMPPAAKKRKAVEKASENKEKVPKLSCSATDGGKEWRDECQGIRDINQYALKNKVLCDVTFLVGPESDPLPAHRLILALGSPVFEAMFYGPLAEKNDTIAIPDMDPKGFFYLLQFLYTEYVCMEDETTVFKIAFAADKYCVTPLKQKCENFLCDVVLTPSNVWMFLQNAVFLNSDTIKTKCFEYLKLNIGSALSHNSFMDTSARTIEVVLDIDCLKIREIALWEAVLQWAQHNCKDPEDRKSLLKPFLRQIRFKMMQAADFVHCLELYNLKDMLGAEDALAILQHAVLPATCPLPDWCCTKPRHYPASDIPKSRVFRRLVQFNRMSGDSTSSSSSSSSFSSSSTSTSLSSDTE